MNLKEHYRELLIESMEKIDAEDYEVDQWINSDADKRFGITLRLIPSESVKANIQNFIEEVKAIEPDQYFYPNSDIHVTVMSIISCYEGFDLDKIQIGKYIDIIANCLLDTQSFQIQFKGLTASKSCIMLQGYTDNDLLNEARGRLRTAFKSSDLEQSLDKRYAIQTAHSTIIRFKTELAHKEELLKMISKNADRNFGSFEVKSMELVYNDWYHRKGIVIKLHDFDL